MNWNKMVMFMEITDYCNANCIMCGAHREKKYPHNRPKTLMPFDDFKKIIENIVSSPIRPSAIVYSWLGESLLHPEFPEFLKFSHESGFTNQQFNTNGLALTPEVVDKLVEIESLKRIHLSLDSAVANDWQKIKGVSGFEKVIDNIKYLLKVREQTGSDINLIFAYIVQSKNFKNGGKFIELISSMLNDVDCEFKIAWDVVHEHDRDIILFSRLLTASQGDANKLHKRFLVENGLIENNVDLESSDTIIETDQITVENRFSDQYSADTLQKRSPCASLWFMPNVDSTGKLTICCHDINLQHSIGNLKETSFEKLWFGETMEKYRNQHINGDFNNIKLCSKCGGIEHFTFE